MISNNFLKKLCVAMQENKSSLCIYFLRRLYDIKHDYGHDFVIRFEYIWALG